MAPASSRNPSNWDEYHGTDSRSGSLTSSVLAEEQALLDDDEDGDSNYGGHHVRARRRSSVTNQLAAIADIGGVNSIRSFARSWQRAAGFHEVIPRRPSFVFNPEQNAEPIQYGRSYVDANSSMPQTGLLGQHLQNSLTNGESSTGVDPASQPGEDNFRDRESKAVDVEMAGALPAESYASHSSIFAVPPHLAAPDIVGSYGSYRGSNYGTMQGSLRHRISIDQAAAGWVQGGDEDEGDTAHGELEPILVKEVKQGNKVVLTVEGQSTLPQSVFNSINAIIGVGLLSLPLAFKMSGWIIGLLILTMTAAVTAHTAKLLSKCMDFDPSLITYSDLAYISFGARARVIVSALFTLELVGACVALMILFADSLDLLLPGLASVNIWKVVAAILVLALNALPLRLLSYTSVIGIFSTFCIVCIIIMDGLIKPDSPGSLREPAMTYLLPNNWLTVPLAYGLLASPWGAHSVFPSIYRDMRHPYKWGKAVAVTFSFSYVVDTCLAVIGILMFGDGIRDAITSNVLRTKGYPEGLTILMCIFIAIIPLTKIPLNARPIITTLDVVLGVHQDHHINPGMEPRKIFVKQIVRVAARFSVVTVILFISIVFPAFDSVCAFLGAALCTLISVILPISFHLKLFWRDISVKERIISGILLVLFSFLGLVGTIWTFLPKHMIGAD